MSVAESESSSFKTPEWLEVLENKRKRIHKLAHEVGAGAPCLNCKEKCKGLNLHFWRKLCIECKCKKEDHEVDEEENDYAQFEILLGSKKVKKTTLKFNSQIKSFDWVPPNASQELVIDYLKSIPFNKLPISNSEGARYRKQQLNKQIPLHDINPNICHNLSFQEIEEFKKYLDNLKTEVIGQGKIIKYQVPQKIKETYVLDSFINMVANSEEFKIQKLEDSELNHKAMSFKNEKYKKEFLKYFEPNLQNKNFSTFLKKDAEKLNNLTTFGDCFFSEKQGILKEVKYDQSNDELQHEKLLNDSEKLKENCNINELKPCDIAICKESLGEFKELKISSSDVPFIPVQEVNVITSKKSGYNEKNDNKTKEKNNDFENFPAPPETCQQCLSILNPEEVVVKTDRGGNFALWHASCFVCETCKELLVDLMYFFHQGKVFCGRHYAEIMKIPRCYACDELIFVKEYTHAEGQSYHVKHFCCFHCDQPLAGKQYILKDDNPICLDCYEINFGKKCHTCFRPILAKERRISWKNLDFHVSASCFKCTGCKSSLLERKFVVRNNQVFCSKDCLI